MLGSGIGILLTNHEEGNREVVSLVLFERLRRVIAVENRYQNRFLFSAPVAWVGGCLLPTREPGQRSVVIHGAMRLFLAWKIERWTNPCFADVQGNCIGPDGASALADVLRSNTSLTRLYVGGAGIKARGACAMASALVTNTVLR